MNHVSPPKNYTREKKEEDTNPDEDSHGTQGQGLLDFNLIKQKIDLKYIKDIQSREMKKPSPSLS